MRNLFVLFISFFLFGGYVFSEKKIVELDPESGMISIKAEKQSLIRLIEELDNETGENFISHLKEDVIITLNTDSLDLQQTITRLREFADINYITGDKDKNVKVKKVLVFNKGEYFKSKKRPSTGKPTSKQQEQEITADENEPFKMEFDPEKYL